ncbi:hypothetical protein K7432_016219, partial [Basidiobolus ranarum]
MDSVNVPIDNPAQSLRKRKSVRSMFGRPQSDIDAGQDYSLSPDTLRSQTLALSNWVLNESTSTNPGLLGNSHPTQNFNNYATVQGLSQSSPNQYGLPLRQTASMENSSYRSSGIN